MQPWLTHGKQQPHPISWMHVFIGILFLGVCAHSGVFHSPKQHLALMSKRGIAGSDELAHPSLPFHLSHHGHPWAPHWVMMCPCPALWCLTT